MSLLDNVDFKEHVAATARKFNIPGISISLVDLKRGEVSSKGFDYQTSETITGDTVFPLCSNTKLFTTVAYGILVEEGKCAWSSKLCELLPGLKLQDDHAQRTLTVEDLLSHQSGLGSHILAVTSTTPVLSSVVDSINGLRFSKPARSAYQYCNVAFQLMGYLVSILSGMPFEDFVDNRILKPLNMLHTTWTAPRDGDKFAQGYLTTWTENEQLREKIQPRYIGLPRNSLLAPLVGMLSTAADMGKWLAFLLRLAKSEATTSDLTIIKPETWKEILRSRVIADQQIGALPVQAGTTLWPETSVPTYALGQLRGSYRGVDISTHNGTGLGGGSIVVWTPGKDFGICILTNTLGTVYHAGISIALTALDMHLSRATLDWNERSSIQPSGQTNSLPAPPEASEAPSPWPISRLCGTYIAPSYGRMELVDLAAANASQDLDQRVEHLMELYESSKPFGKMWERKPVMLAVCENNVCWDAYELHYISGGRFFGVPIRLIDQTEIGGSIVKAPVWTYFGAALCAAFEFANNAAEKTGMQFEYFTTWQEASGRTGLASGLATFVKSQ